MVAISFQVLATVPPFFHCTKTVELNLLETSITILGGEDLLTGSFKLTK